MERSAYHLSSNQSSNIRFSQSSIDALKKNFAKHCNGNKMKLQEFRSMLGILGLDNASFICDRLFAVIAGKFQEVSLIIPTTKIIDYISRIRRTNGCAYQWHN